MTSKKKNWWGKLEGWQKGAIIGALFGALAFPMAILGVIGVHLIPLSLYGVYTSLFGAMILPSIILIKLGVMVAGDQALLIAIPGWALIGGIIGHLFETLK